MTWVLKYWLLLLLAASPFLWHSFNAAKKNKTTTTALSETRSTALKRK